MKYKTLLMMQVVGFVLSQGMYLSGCAGGVDNIKNKEVRNLVKKLDSDNARERFAAVQALGNIKTDTDKIISAITPYLKDKEVQVRLLSAEAMMKLGKAEKGMPVFLKILITTQNERLYSQAALISREIGPSDSACAPLIFQSIKELAKKYEEEGHHGHLDTVGYRLGLMITQIGDAAVPTLIREAKDTKSLVPARAVAIYLLGNVGYGHKELVPIFTRALSDSHVYMRRSAAEALGKIGPVSRTAVNDLIKAAKDKDPDVRRHAIKSLGWIGPVSKAVTPCLIAALKDKNSDVVTSATKALGNIGPLTKDAAPYLIKCLESKKDWTRTYAAIALGKIGKAAGKKAASALDKALKNEQAFFASEKMIMALGKIGPSAKDTIPNLIKFLRDRNMKIQINAAIALGRIGNADDRKVVPALFKALKNERDGSVCEQIILTLGKIGGEDKTITKFLIDMLKNKSESNRMAVLQAFERNAKKYHSALLKALNDSDNIRIGVRIASILGTTGHSKKAVPYLIKALENKDNDIRENAVKALGNIGAAAKTAIPCLLKILSSKSENESVRNSVAWALGVIYSGEPTIIKGLIKAVNNDSIAAIRALGEIGPPAKQAVPILAKLVKAGYWERRVEAAVALAQMGPAAKEALPEIKRALEDKDLDVRMGAAVALGRLESPDKAVQLLIEALRSKIGYGSRIFAIRGLGKLGKDAKAAVPFLVRLWIYTNRQEKDKVRMTVIQALGEIGPGAKAAIPDLEMILRLFANDDMRNAIVQALSKIRKGSAK